MKKESTQVYSLLARYLLLIFVALFGFKIFHTIFLPLTKYPVYYFLRIFFEPNLFGDSIQIGPKIIEIAEACVASSAYYFLLILNLGTPKIKVGLRLKLILFSFFGFLIANIVRIILLSFMYLENSSLFELTHKILWYFGSTFLLVLIWFLGIKIFKINSIPFYSDLKNLYSKSILIKK